MNKALIWIMIFLVSIVGAMAATSCITDGGGYKRCLDYSATPCLNNIQLNTRFVLNITASSCNPNFSLSYAFQQRHFGSNTCGAGGCVYQNYNGFTRAYVDNVHNVYPITEIKQYCPPLGDPAWSIYGAICTSSGSLGNLRDDIMNACENVTVKLDLYYGDSNVQSIGDPYGTLVNMSYQYTPHKFDGHGLYWPFPNGTFSQTIWYPALGYTFDSDSAVFDMNKSGTYTLRIGIKGDSITSSASYFFINYTVRDSGGGLYEQCTTTSASTVYPPDNDAFNTTFGSFGGYWTKGLLWFLMMAIFGAVIYFATAKVTGKFVWLIIGLVEVILLIIGAYIHIISWLFIGVPMFILVLWGAYKLKEVFS